MKRKIKKIIIILVILAIVIPTTYIAYTNYQNYEEQKNFNKTMKNISDIENQSDIKANELSSESSVDILIPATANDINTTTKEIDMLQNLSDNTHNQTYKEYINIQIDRLETEKMAYTSYEESLKTFESYKNGSKSYSQTVTEYNEYKNDTKKYNDKIGDKKDESTTFLDKHNDLKNTLEKLNIDEDFLINQKEKRDTIYLT